MHGVPSGSFAGKPEVNVLASTNSLANWKLGVWKGMGEIVDLTCKSVTYRGLLQAHLQQQVKILLCLALTVGSPPVLKGMK